VLDEKQILKAHNSQITYAFISLVTALLIQSPARYCTGILLLAVQWMVHGLLMS